MSNPLEERFRRSWFEHLSRLREVEAACAPEIEGDPALRYSVPRIVCIGEESSGKSSTLERVAMMSVFPSDERLCTRVPIELRLRHRDRESLAKEEERFRDGYVVMKMAPGEDSKLNADVSSQMHPDEVPAQVRTWMEELVAAANGKVTGVTDDRIIIELYSPLCVNLDLIDLPGIVAGSIPGEPTDMMDRTRNLSASFLNDKAHPHTFVIAVASAREARIRNSQAMELVQRYNKVQFTIGALTMADLSADSRRESPYTRLIERLNAQADDTPELGLGYVALKNRDTVTATRENQSREELEKANQDEKEWFAEHLSGHTERCGIESLVDRLVQKVDEYTRGPWIVAERERIETELVKVRQELSDMGEFLPNDLNELISYFSSEIEKQCKPSFETLLEFVPTVTSGSAGLQDIYDAANFTIWQHSDIHSLMPSTDPNTGSTDPNTLKTFDGRMFYGEPTFTKRWSPFVKITHKHLFGQDTQTPETPSHASSNGVWTMRRDAINTISHHFNQTFCNGSLLFVGRRCSYDDDGCGGDKLVGFFITQDMIQQRRHDIQTMLAALGKRVPTDNRSPWTKRENHESDSQDSNSQSPNNVGTGTGFDFASNPFTQRAERGPFRRARRSTRGGLEQDEVVVLYHPARPAFRAKLEISEDLEKYYENVLHLRESVVRIFQTNARAFFKSSITDVLDVLKAKDARFSVFFESLSVILDDWCEVCVRNVTTEFAEWLTRTGAVSENRDAHFQITASYFTNSITRKMREMIFFHYADSSIAKVFESGELNEIMRRHCDEHNIDVDDLYVENCVEQRKKAVMKMEMLTTMKNSLHQIFTSEVDEQSNEQLPNTPEADAAPVPTLSHSLSRTSI